MDLTPSQVALLERFHAHGYEIVAFPMYASSAGLRKGDCAALLAPSGSSGLRLLGEPSFLISGNFSVRIQRGKREFFVWKKQSLEATPERLEELRRFSDEVRTILGAETAG